MFVPVPVTVPAVTRAAKVLSMESAKRGIMQKLSASIAR